MGIIVAIVGKPNVGKSTFFNRIIKSREAIVDSESGITRDRNYGKSFWNGQNFTLIDTGGYVLGSDDEFEKEIDKQVLIAVEEADFILFMVDLNTGVMGLDEEVSKLLHRSSKKVFLVVNKVDNALKQSEVGQFYSLGYKTLYPISGINGSGTGELLDDLTDCFPEINEEALNEYPNFAVVGRPNAGKSSFINVLLDEERYIVTDKAGTTRDSILTHYNRFGFEFNIIDTAGIRRKTKVKEKLEFYSVMRSIRSIENCDVAFLIMDATREFDSQVQNIFWLINKNNKGIVILVNKWDLVDKTKVTTKMVEERIKKEIQPFDDVPILFISSLTKQRVFKSLEAAIDVYERRSKKIPTKKLNEMMLPIIQKTPPPIYKGKLIRIKFCYQLPSKYPQFVFYCNLPQYIKESYSRFLENKLRQLEDFNGVPISIFFRKK